MQKPFPAVTVLPISVTGYIQSLRTMLEVIERYTPQSWDQQHELVESFEPVREQILALAGVADFRYVPGNTILTDEIIEAYKAIKAERYDAFAEDPVFPPTKPFHTAILDYIQSADTFAWDKAGDLLKQGFFIPPEHRASVANAYILRGRELGMRHDRGVVAAIMAQYTPDDGDSAEVPDYEHLP